MQVKRYWNVVNRGLKVNNSKNKNTLAHRVAKEEDYSYTAILPNV